MAALPPGAEEDVADVLEPDDALEGNFRNRETPGELEDIDEEAA